MRCYSCGGGGANVARCLGRRPGAWGRLRFVSWIPIAVALVLLTAAGLKTHQLATDPVLGNGLLESRWFLVAVIQYEVFLAFWLASGLFPRAANWVAIGTFGLFALVAFGKVISGEASCGCFGRVPTSPWLSLSIDLLAVVGLWGLRARLIGFAPLRVQLSPEGSRLSRTEPEAVWGSATCHCGLIILWAAMAISFGAAVGRVAPTQELSDVGERVGNAIIVEPESMVGRPFVLGKFIDLGDQLAVGRWFVILYRPGCPQCQTVLHRANLIGAQAPARAQIAFVSLPTHRSGSRSAHEVVPTTGLSGTITDEFDWLLSVPLFLVVEHGRVLATGSSFDDAFSSFASRSLHGTKAGAVDADFEDG